VRIEAAAAEAEENRKQEEQATQQVGLHERVITYHNVHIEKLVLLYVRFSSIVSCAGSACCRSAGRDRSGEMGS
jgi:hypothetical protein